MKCSINYILYKNLENIVEHLQMVISYLILSFTDLIEAEGQKVENEKKKITMNLA